MKKRRVSISKRKVSVSKRKNKGTQKIKGGQYGSLYGGELDIQNDNLKKIVELMPRKYLSFGNIFGNVFGSIFGSMATSVLLAIRLESPLSYFNKRSRQKFIDKLNEATIRKNDKKIEFPHIWKNVSVNNKLIRNPNYYFENYAYVYNGDHGSNFYFHPKTAGYDFECDVNYPHWHGTDLSSNYSHHLEKTCFNLYDISNNPYYEERTRTEWLIDNPLEFDSVNESIIKQPIEFTPEDKEQMTNDIKKAAEEVKPVSDNSIEQTSTTGGKYKKSRRYKSKYTPMNIYNFE